MKKVFVNRHKALLTTGAIGFVILSILAVAYLSSPLRSSAKPLAASDIQQSFQDFCDFYYSDEPDDEQANDVPNCEAISDPFANIIPADAQSEWPDQSLKQLALAGIRSTDNLKRALLDKIGDKPDQRALINNDPDFIPTLFAFELSDLNSAY